MDEDSPTKSQISDGENGGSPPGESSIEKKFNAGIKVIQNLPKDGNNPNNNNISLSKILTAQLSSSQGPYQPSNMTKLRFYGLYKQATEGPCSQSPKGRKPAFWDVINRAKWEAWNKIGDDMNKNEAMHAYVEELKQMMMDYMMDIGFSMSKKIIETMSFNGDVQGFLDVIGPFYEFITPEQAAAMNGNGEHSHQNGGLHLSGQLSIDDDQDLISSSIDRLIENNTNGQDISSSQSPSSSNSSLSRSSNSPEISPEKIAMLRQVQGLMTKAKELKIIPKNLDNTPETLLGKVLNLKHQNSNGHGPSKKHENNAEYDSEGSTILIEHVPIQIPSSSFNPQGVNVNKNFDNFDSENSENEKYYSDDGSPGDFTDGQRQKFGKNSSQKFGNQKQIAVLQTTTDRLNRDVEHILARLRILEASYTNNNTNNLSNNSTTTRGQGSRSTLGKIFSLFNPRSNTRSRLCLNIFFLIMWPFIANYIFRLISNYVRSRRSGKKLFLLPKKL